MRTLLDATETTHERVVITRNGKPSAVLVAADDLESMEETIAILSDPELMAAIKEGQTDVEAGRTYSLETILADRAKRQ